MTPAPAEERLRELMSVVQVTADPNRPTCVCTWCRSLGDRPIDRIDDGQVSRLLVRLRRSGRAPKTIVSTPHDSLPAFDELDAVLHRGRPAGRRDGIVSTCRAVGTSPRGQVAFMRAERFWWHVVRARRCRYRSSRRFGQLVRFGTVGCSNTLLSWCAYVLLVWAGAATTVVTFLLSRQWAFAPGGPVGR
jgi:hypothetical protein